MNQIEDITAELEVLMEAYQYLIELGLVEDVVIDDEIVLYCG